MDRAPTHRREVLCHLATTWVEKFRSTGAEVPARVPSTLMPSTSCLCAKTDYSYRAFRRYKKQSYAPQCSPCSRKSTCTWYGAGAMYRKHQLCFWDGTLDKTMEAGMTISNEVIIIDSSICCTCRNALSRGVERVLWLTAGVLLATLRGSLLPRVRLTP